MIMATQKQIDFVNRIEKRIEKKYQGTYDIGSVSNFIDKNIFEYKKTFSMSSRFFKDVDTTKEKDILNDLPDYPVETNEELFNLIDEEF